MAQTMELEEDLERKQSSAPAADDRSKRSAPRFKVSRLILLAVILAAAVGAILWYLHSQDYESTDDAQIEGHLDVISARISGTVTYINPKVENNQVVEAGTLLVELDPRDYQAELERAKANLGTRSAAARAAGTGIPIVNANAYGSLHAAEAARDQALSGVEAEVASLAAAQHKLQLDEAVYARAERDRVRYQALVEKREISRSDYDQRETAATTSAQLVEADRSDIQSRERRISEARSLVQQREAQIDSARTAPQQVVDAQAKSASAGAYVDQARADLHTAELNLSYTKLYAPVTGVVGRKTVELGHRVQPGQSLLLIVPQDDIWVTANFKETQLKKIRPGKAVTIHVDTFGREYRGKVDSMPGAAGPVFSLFPPENATGNYVKVVQRFPVRIRFEPGQDPDHLLRPGMSVEPTVDLR